MTYTAEQLRVRAETAEQMLIYVDPSQLRAHADALEENARLTRECEFHAKQCARVDELRHRAEAELAKLRQMVAQQAEDEGLWFNAATAPEAYLQQELRKLHAAVEETK